MNTALQIISLAAIVVPALVRALGYADTAWGRVVLALLVDVRGALPTQPEAKP